MRDDPRGIKRMAMALGLVLAAACSTGEEDTKDPITQGDLPREASSGGETAEEHDGECPAEPWSGSWEGLWAQKQVRVAEVFSQFLNGNRRVNTTLYRIEVRRDGDRLDLASTVCGSEVVTEGSLAETTFLDTLIPSIGVQHKSARAEPIGQGFRFVQDLFVEVRGAHLEDPDREDLPRDEGDPRIYDQDQDGRPGITVLVQGPISGAIWLVQRLRTRLVGCTSGEGRVRGGVEWEEGQVFLGAEQELLKSPITIRPIPEDSVFEMVRVPDGTDCEQIQAQRATLFRE